MNQNIPKILGVDFDDTLFLDSYPNNFSRPCWENISHVIKRKNEGWYIILVTCRHTDDMIEHAVKVSRSVGVEFDAVNENHPLLIEKYGDCRKIYCDEYLDDKNIIIR